MLTDICQCPLTPVGAAQAGLAMQASALFVQVILPAGIGCIVHQQTFLKVGCLIDAVLQRAGIERHIAVNQLGSFLCKGILCLLQGGSLFGSKIRPPFQLHLHAVCPVFPTIRRLKNWLR